jgi:hypothetical protein
MDWRTFVFLAAVSLAGCSSGANASSTPWPSATSLLGSTTTASPTATHAVAEPTIGPISTPTANLLEPFETAKIVVDGLAVRQAPGTSRPFVEGHRNNPDGTSDLVTDEVRLPRGYYVLVDAGPLLFEDIPWYRVENLPQPGQDPTDELVWQSQTDRIHNWGWVAGSARGTSYLKEAAFPYPSDSPPFYPLPRYWTMHGVGSARSSTLNFPPLDEGVWNPVQVQWVALDPDGGSCGMKVTMRPDGWDMGSGTVIDWGGGALSSPPEEVLLGEKWLEVESDCSWTLTAGPSQG